MEQTATVKAVADAEEFETAYVVREAIALFANEDAFETAILGLQENGVDRSRISVLGNLPQDKETSESSNWMHHLVDAGQAPRGAPVDHASLAEAKSAMIAVPGYAGAALGLSMVLASGGALGFAIAAAILTGALGGGAGALLDRSIGKRHRDEVETQLEAGGLIVWVKLADDDETVSRLLEETGGKHIHVETHEASWGSKDIPLSTTQPDPFL
jgi:outer membrane lipoprotein SlyB